MATFLLKQNRDAEPFEAAAHMASSRARAARGSEALCQNAQSCRPCAHTARSGRVGQDRRPALRERRSDAGASGASVHRIASAMSTRRAARCPIAPNCSASARSPSRRRGPTSGSVRALSVISRRRAATRAAANSTAIIRAGARSATKSSTDGSSRSPRRCRAFARRTNADLRKSGLPREKVLAAVVQLLEKTLIRVGNEEYARDNGSFGLTTMRDQHAKIQGQTVRFEFRGKSGIRARRRSAATRRLARIVKACRDLPGYELFQYVDEDGARQVIDSADVNAYLREISGAGFHREGLSHVGGHGARREGAGGARRASRRTRKPSATSCGRSNRSRSGWATPKRSAGSATSIPRSSTRTWKAPRSATLKARARRHR